MAEVGRRQFLISTGAIGVAGLAGCSGDGEGTEGNGETGGGGDGTSTGTAGQDLTPVEIVHPEGVVTYPMYEGALDEGIFEEEGLELSTNYAPFDTQVQSVSSGDYDVTAVSMMPYVSNYLAGEDVVSFGFSGCLQFVNGLYVSADSDYESVEDLEGDTIGVWSFGSSTVQSFQAILAEEFGLQLREDFQTTTAPPPALLGLLDDGEVDGIINTSGLTITMQSQPDQYQRLMQLNNVWEERTDNYLPLTSWFSNSEWYDQNTETAAALLRGTEAATEHWRNNTESILQEHGEQVAIDNEAKREVVVDWASEGQVFQQAPQDDSFVDSTWEFVELMAQEGFIDSAPSQEDILRNPL